MQETPSQPKQTSQGLPQGLPPLSYPFPLSGFFPNYMNIPQISQQAAPAAQAAPVLSFNLPNSISKKQPTHIVKHVEETNISEVWSAFNVNSKTKKIRGANFEPNRPCYYCGHYNLNRVPNTKKVCFIIVFLFLFFFSFCALFLFI